MNVEWEIINPGRILLGTNNRTILFGGIGPRHEVKIDYQFEICKYPLKKEICEKLLLEGCEIASESEWFLALNQNKIFGNNEIEEFSDKINNSYWGKICDGSPFISDDWIFRLGCEWKSGKNNIIQIEKENDEVEYHRLVRNKKKISTKIVNLSDGKGIVQAINYLIKKKEVNIYKFNDLQVTINSPAELKDAKVNYNKYFTLNEPS